MLALLRSDLDEAWLVSAGLAYAPVLQLGQVAGKAVSHGFPLLFLGLRASWSLSFSQCWRKGRRKRNNLPVLITYSSKKEEV